MEINIIYQDKHLLVVNKPSGIHVHRTKLSHREESLQDILEKQLNTILFPIHRLDKPVNGLMIIAKNSEAASIMAASIRERKNFSKNYLALVRGFMKGSGFIDHPLRQASGKPERSAVTEWISLKTAEAPWSDGIFPTSRYSLIECIPKSGRFHQIRRHLSIASHPIIGDIAHGDNKRNKIWIKQCSIKGLFLFSYKISFIHPISKKYLSFTVKSNNIDKKFILASRILGWGNMETIF